MTFDSTTTPASPRTRFAVGLLREHYEELEFLWDQRQSALESSVLSVRYLRELEERIEAHVQGLLIGGTQLLPVVSEGLTGDDPLLAFAAAYPLLRLGMDSAAQLVMNAFMEAKPPALEGFCAALCHGSIAPLVPRLRQAVDGASDWHSVIASEILGFHHHGDISIGYIERLCRHEDPAIRRAAWHASWHARPLHVEVYEDGINDPEEIVRWFAIVSAAWSREKWLMGRLREFGREAPEKHWSAVAILAILGTPAELPCLQMICSNATIGPERYQVLASYGHPGLMESILAGIESDDPLTAASAGAAFTRMTGVNIESDKRSNVRPKGEGDGGHDFDEDFADEVTLPDAAIARAHWSRVKPQFAKCTRLCHGFDLGRPVGREITDQLDLKSRWETALRGAYEGSWTGVAADLERFPLAH